MTYRDGSLSVTCIGIDLAWSPRNWSGVAVIQGSSVEAVLMETKILKEDTEILALVDRYTQTETVLVAVDAPLHVPNLTGRRSAEAEIGQIFRPYHAGAHPANRQRLVFDGVVRGEALVEQLIQRGFVHTTPIEPNQPIRQVIEVFPHSGMVGIFDLERILKYKAKPSRSWEERLQAWKRYQTLMASLQEADPSLQGQDQLVQQPIHHLKGRQLKDYEDQMDAVICAYIVLYGFRWGSQRCRTFGNLTDGYIFTPVPRSLWKIT